MKPYTIDTAMDLVVDVDTDDDETDHDCPRWADCETCEALAEAECQ